METSSYVALSKQAAMSRDMDVIANNIANASTTGYRGEHSLFQEYLARTGTPGRRDYISYAQDSGLFRDLRNGGLSTTGNPYDLALNGDGYFVVGEPGGEFYARTSEFHLDEQRRMVTSDGYALLQENGSPLVIPPGDDTNVTISGDGVVNGSQGEIGRLRLVRFNDQQAMRRTGNGMYVTDQQSLPATDVRVVQGALEQSNVQPVIEVTRMLGMMRDYQNAQQLINSEDQRMRDMIDRLAKVA